VSNFYCYAKCHHAECQDNDTLHNDIIVCPHCDTLRSDIMSIVMPSVVYAERHIL
jgi:hypothetical protein